MWSTIFANLITPEVQYVLPVYARTHWFQQFSHNWTYNEAYVESLIWYGAQDYCCTALDSFHHCKMLTMKLHFQLRQQPKPLYSSISHSGFSLFPWLRMRPQGQHTSIIRISTRKQDNRIKWYESKAAFKYTTPKPFANITLCVNHTSQNNTNSLLCTIPFLNAKYSTTLNEKITYASTKSTINDIHHTQRCMGSTNRSTRRIIIQTLNKNLKLQRHAVV